MIAKRNANLISLEDAAKIEFATFPGGYSPHKTRGDCVFSPAKAQAAINFFARHLVHVKGKDFAGKPMVLEQWQKDIIGSLFGWIRPDGTRRYRVAYIEIPRKAGKSTLSAGIALLLLYMDDEPGAEVYSCAADREQAAIVFELAKENVLRNKVLESRSKLYLRSIVHLDPKTGIPKGSYKVLSADAHTKHGYNPHGIIFDELHAQPNANLWDVMNTGTGARQQPLTVAITTAGYDRQSVCYQQRTYAEKVRDGISEDNAFLPVIYAANADDDWTAPETWYKAQPNLGVSVPESFYAAEMKRAQEMPVLENSRKRLYLNIWTEQESRAIPMDQWDACHVLNANETPQQRRERMLEELSGAECYGGLDLASKIDIAAFVLVFQRDDRIALLPWFWAPSDAASRRAKEPGNTGRYQQWASEGFIELIDGPRIDQDVIRQHIVALSERFRIHQIAYDPWNAEKIRIELEADGLAMVEFHQGLRNFCEPTKEFISLVTAGKVDHGSNPVLRWMASNLSTKEDASGNIRPDKGSSGDKIDGIVSGIMGLALTMLAGEPMTSDSAVVLI